MNAELQAILEQLNSSEAVSLPDFINALEQEPSLELSSVFAGTEISGSSINWKNTSDDLEDMKDYQYFVPDNTSSWNFTLTKFNIYNIVPYLTVESSDDTGSVISAVITGNMTGGGITIPVLLTKSEEYLTIYLYLEDGTSQNFEFSFLESYLEIPSFKEYYPESMNLLPGLDCFSLSLQYSMSSRIMEFYTIRSSAPEWNSSSTETLRFYNCSISCTIFLPLKSDSLFFAVNGNMTYLSSASGSGAAGPSFSDSAFLFQNDGLALLADFGNISGLLFNELKYLYISASQDIVSSIKVVLDHDSVNPAHPVNLEELDMNFYYSSEVCDLKGELSAG
nr:hypothetical protein [Bacteroidales bacterium]